MNDQQRSAIEGYVCPNCHTLNNPNAEVCVGCGVHLFIFNEVKAELSQKVSDRQSELLQSIKQETAQQKRKDQKIIRNDFFRNIILLLVVTAVLVPVIWGTLKIIQIKRVEQQKYLAGNYQNGKDCYDKSEYQCAEDYFQKVYAKEKDYQNNRYLLINSKLQIAEEYYRDGIISLAITKLDDVLAIDQVNPTARKLLNEYHTYLAVEYKKQKDWQKAIEEYTYAINANPDDFNARKEINDLYKIMINEASAKGNWIEVWKLRNQKKSFNK